jgi:hypothetical protein
MVRIDRNTPSIHADGVNTMAAHADDKPVLLIKKFGAVASLVLGLLLTATGLSGEYPTLTMVGVLLLAFGAILLVLKILRRNQGGP